MSDTEGARLSNRDPVNRDLVMRRRAGLLMIVIILAQFGYPITTLGQGALLAFQLVYASMVLVGIWVTRDSRRIQLITAASGLLYLCFGIWYALHPTQLWRIGLAYAALPFYLGTLCFVLLRFIFRADEVTRGVIWAAVCLYLLLGGLFVPLYGIIEILMPGAFVDSNLPNERIVWQQLVYFSYTTLTTVGYGDVLPVNWWARALANIEGVTGVLFIAVLVGRLVGVYRGDK